MTHSVFDHAPDLRKHEDGWVEPRCICGVTLRSEPDELAAMNALMTHAYEMGDADCVHTMSRGTTIVVLRAAMDLREAWLHKIQFTRTTPGWKEAAERQNIAFNALMAALMDHEDEHGMSYEFGAR